MNVAVKINEYDESTDMFLVEVSVAGDTRGGWTPYIPACLMPKLTGMYGAPEEFIGKTFEIEA
jgi:hypothetical protein